MSTEPESLFRDGSGYSDGPRDFQRTKTFRRRATPEEDSAAIARSFALLGRLQHEVWPALNAEDEPATSLEESIGWNVDPVTGRPRSV